jgi:hypothetical protein
MTHTNSMLGLARMFAGFGILFTKSHAADFILRFGKGGTGRL